MPIKPSAEGWERFAAWFERDPSALEAGWRELVSWEVDLRAELQTVEASDG